MGRLIDADALIEAINEQVKGWGKNGIIPSLFSAVAIIQNQPTAYDVEKIVAEIEENQSGWIPCSERLPEIDKDVLVCFSNDMDFVIAYHTRMIETNYEDVWINSSTANRITSNVLAWMPLPAPYQPKGE